MTKKNPIIGLMATINRTIKILGQHPKFFKVDLRKFDCLL